MIICDTRERKNDHIITYFDRSGVNYEERKIDTGDYLNTDNPFLRVDRKQNLNEVAINISSADSSRFWKELRRTKKERLKMYFLVEHSNNIKTLSDVCKWNSRWSSVRGYELAQKMFNIECAYGVKFVFCSKRETPQRILELLEYDKRRT